MNLSSTFIITKARVVTVFFAVLFVLVFSFSSTSLAKSKRNFHRFFMGVGVGYGSTDWSMLVTSADILNPLLATNPISANDTGVAASIFFGFYMSPYFVIQAGFARFAKTQLSFADGNTYNKPSYDAFSMYSNTYAYSLLFKIVVPVPGYPRFRPFLDAGATFIARSDILAHKAHLGPQFGIGFLVPLNHRFFASIGFQYYTGFGKSDKTPAHDYIPFLYQIRASLAVWFS